jgi:hypothetical protein
MLRLISRSDPALLTPVGLRNHGAALFDTPSRSCTARSSLLSADLKTRLLEPNVHRSQHR